MESKKSKTTETEIKKNIPVETEAKCSCGCEDDCSCNDDCGCDDECDCGEKEDIITLTSEEGEQIDFYHEATIEYKNEWFVFLHPVQEMAEIGEDEVVIFKLIKSEEGEDSLEPIEDEELLNNVYDEYVKIIDSYEEEDEVK